MVAETLSINGLIHSCYLSGWSAEKQNSHAQ